RPRRFPASSAAGSPRCRDSSTTASRPPQARTTATPVATYSQEKRSSGSVDMVDCGSRASVTLPGGERTPGVLKIQTSRQFIAHGSGRGKPAERRGREVGGEGGDYARQDSNLRPPV